MARKQPGVKDSRVNEEKLLNEMFVLLEYSDSFKEFVQNLSEDCRQKLYEALTINKE